MKVSIISPIYKGKHYIPALINQTEACKIHAGNDIEIELVLSNDDPENPLEDYESELIDIVVLNTEVNRGIQAARIRGLEKAGGEYIVFLDQDDRIYPDYVISQVRAIGDNEAVVCRCINEGRPKYNAGEPFEKMITREYMLTKGDPIVSTGPVLIRKECVPKTWKNNILKTSGADDYFLWLCMLAEGYNFSLNQEILYEHIVNGVNTSLNTYRMMTSEQEMLEVIKKNNLFKNEPDSIFDELANTIMQKHLKILDKFRLMFFSLNNILVMQENNVSLSSCLQKRGVANLAIYGAGYVGRRVYGFLRDSDIKVRCFVDRNADYLNEPVPSYTMDNIPDNVDSILVTLMQDADKVVYELRNRYPDLKVIELTELLNTEEVL